MAGDSVIGALRVDLGLNSAQFTDGLKKAQTGLATFGEAAKVGLQLVTAAAAAATVALGFAVKGAIDHADALSKAAQKAGVTVEALSRIAYAAQFSEISLDEMTASLGKLSKTMADATQNVHGASASAFAALGINVTDASGKLRSADAVFSEVADRFSRLQDGATKTAISMALFGKSGAQLIPLLNEGAAGLKRYADESDRIGNTISTKTATAANKFNDTLTKVGSIMGGVVNQVMEAALPALQQLADVLASPKFAEAAKTLATGVINALSTVAQVVVGLTNAFGDLAKAIGNAFQTAQQSVGGKTVAQLKAELKDWQDNLAGPNNESGRIRAQDRIDAITKQIAQLSTVGGAGLGATGGATGLVPAPTSGGNGGLTIDLGGADEATKKANLLKDALKDIGPAGKTAADMASKSLRDLGDNAFGSLANLSGALSSLFKQNKAFAVATAVLQGLQGVAYALGSSAPPWNFINAAAVGIEAAANVANILSTNENSTSMPSTGSSGASATAVASAPTTPTTNVYLYGQVFSGEAVADLLTNVIKDNGGNGLVNAIWDGK